MPFDKYYFGDYFDDTDDSSEEEYEEFLDECEKKYAEDYSDEHAFEFEDYLEYSGYSKKEFLEWTEEERNEAIIENTPKKPSILDDIDDISIPSINQGFENGFKIEEIKKENDWYCKDMTLSAEQTMLLYKFLLKADVYIGSAIQKMVAMALLENEPIVVNANW